MPFDPGTSGYLIAITGIPSAGKSTVAREVASRTSTFRYVDGDAFIRRTRPSQRLAQASRIFGRMLDMIEAQLTLSNVVLDAAFPASYTLRARERFRTNMMLVSLRIDESEWRRRDSRRNDRGALEYWHASLTSLQGAENLYDLVIDTTDTPPDKCAEAILSKARERWEDVRP